MSQSGSNAKLESLNMTEAGAGIGPWAWPGDEEFTQAEISLPKRKPLSLPPTALHPAAAESRGRAPGGTASRVIAGFPNGLHHHNNPVPYYLLDCTPDRTGAAIYFGTSLGLLAIMMNIVALHLFFSEAGPRRGRPS